MEFYYYRRILLLNQDVPFSTSTSPHVEPSTITNNNNSSSSTFGRPLQLAPRPIFSPNVIYAFLIIFTALFFLALIILYIRQFSRDSPAEDSSSRHHHHHRRSHPHPSCEWVDPTSASKSLPEFSYHGDEKQQVDCAICLEELREGEKVKMIVYCKHVFHSECIDRWVAAHVTCPICRCNKLCEVRVGEDEHGLHGHGGESRMENGEEEGREVTVTVT